MIPRPQRLPALIVMAKRPAPGQTKTRLSPPLTGEQAAALYECFLYDVLDTVRAVPEITRYLAYPPADGPDYFARLAPDFALLPQEGADLGARLAHVLGACLRSGHPAALALNSDSPNLPAGCIRAGCTRLLSDEADVAHGPCRDGGYYLLGLARERPQLLTGVRMSTPHVFEDTLALADAAGLRVGILPAWYDVDVPDDLRQLAADLADTPPGVAPRTRAWLAEMGW